MAKSERMNPDVTIAHIDSSIAENGLKPQQVERPSPLRKFQVEEVEQFTNWLFFNNKEQGQKLSRLKDATLDLMIEERNGKYFPQSDAFRKEYVTEEAMRRRGISSDIIHTRMIRFRNIALSHVLLTDPNMLPDGLGRTVGRVKKIYTDIYNDPALKEEYRQKHPEK